MRLLPAALVALAVVVLPAAAAPARPDLIVLERDGAVLAQRPDGSARTRLATGGDPDLSPDGTRIAFTRGDAVFVLDLATRRTSRVGRGAQPAWAPDGRRLARVVDGIVHVGGRALGPGSAPAWSADGRLAVVVEGRVVVGGEVVAEGTAPAFAPDGRLATIAGDAILVDGRTLPAALEAPADPAWSPDGAQLLVSAGGAASRTLVVVDPATGAASPLPATQPGDARPDWGRSSPPKPPEPRHPVPRPDELLPDLDQRAPTGLSVAGTRLGFASAVDNVGRGPLQVQGRRRTLFAATMRAAQLVRLRGGGRRLYPRVGVLRYTFSPSHVHWHLLDFDRYELRRASDHGLVRRDRKTGFCLADHYGHAPGVPRGAPAFLSNCGQGRPQLLAVEMGSSVGYTDRYPAHYHGQEVDLRGVPAGIYRLVHRANPQSLLHELRYDNNAAAVRIRLTWSGGRPSVALLRSCGRTEYC